MGSAISIIVWMERNINRPVNRLLHVKASGLALKSVCSVRLRSVKIEVGLMLTGFA